MAVVVSGWHYPIGFYKQIKEQEVPDGWDVDYFCVSHRDPDIAKQEKRKRKTWKDYKRERIFGSGKEKRNM